MGGHAAGLNGGGRGLIRAWSVDDNVGKVAQKLIARW